MHRKKRKYIVKWISGCAKIGCAKSVCEVIAVVSTIVPSKRGFSCSVIHGWWDKFRKRHAELVLTVEKLAYKRVIAVNRVVIDHYFDILEAVFESNNLVDKPLFLL